MAQSALYELAAVQQQRGDREGITVCDFDPAHELLWTGGAEGSLQSHMGTSLEQYSFFCAHVSPVLGLLCLPQGPISASKDAVEMHTQGGAPIFSYRYPGMEYLVIREPCCDDVFTWRPL